MILIFPLPPPLPSSPLPSPQHFFQLIRFHLVLHKPDTAVVNVAGSLHPEAENIIAFDRISLANAFTKQTNKHEKIVNPYNLNYCLRLMSDAPEEEKINSES